MSKLISILISLYITMAIILILLVIDIIRTDIELTTLKQNELEWIEWKVENGTPIEYVLAVLDDAEVHGMQYKVTNGRIYYRESLTPPKKVSKKSCNHVYNMII